MRGIFIALMVACFVFCVPGTNAKDVKAEGRIGELLITATGVQETKTDAGRPAKPGFHNVRFTIIVRNVGKHALCTSLNPKPDSVSDHPQP